MEFLAPEDSIFLAYLRALAILGIVLGHVGGFWFFKPYSSYLFVIVSFFFFLSGAVSFYSFKRARNIFVYYKKRIIKLIVPYYMLCILCLLVYISLNKELPYFNLFKFLAWLQIRPSDNMMPFPVGQIWFLHSLFFIILFSPLYFYLVDNDSIVLYFILAFCFSLTILVLYMKHLCHYFIIFHNHLYKSLAYSYFYILGILYFMPYSKIRSNIYLIIAIVVNLTLIIYMLLFLKVNPDIDAHNFPPDVYYFLVSTFSLSVVLLFQNRIYKLFNHINIIDKILKFFHRHTYSIYLLHTFSIYIVERVFGLVNPIHKTIGYGLKKFLLVLILTCIMSIPFTYIADCVSKYLIAFKIKKNSSYG